MIQRTGGSLLWGFLGEINALLDVAIECLVASLKELALLLGHTVKNVDGLLGTVGLHSPCQIIVLACM